MSRVYRLLPWLLGVSFVAGGYFLGKAKAEEGSAPRPLFYSGVLLENGAPSSAESAAITVRLFVPDAKEPACPVTDAVDAPLLAGHFQVALHDQCASVLEQLPQVLIQLEVNGKQLPLRALGTVPFAMHAMQADNADKLAGESPGNFARVGHAHALGAAGASGTGATGLRTDSESPLHYASVKVGGDLAKEICVTPKCDIRVQSGSVQEVLRQEEGIYWVGFHPDTFADAPTCVCNPFQGFNRACTAVTPHNDGVWVHTFRTQTAKEGLVDLGFELMCIGPAAERGQ